MTQARPVARARRSILSALGLTGAAFLLQLFVAASPVVGADAPNRCSAVTATSALGTWHYDAVSSAADVDVFRFKTSSTRYALVTLGRPVRNYKLELYNASCSLIASSNRAGTEYEQIYRSLPAGTYYVAVRPNSSSDYSSTTYGVRFQSLSEGVQVLSTAPAWRDMDSRSVDEYDTCHTRSYLQMAGEILNNTSSQWLVRISATYYDSSNRVIATGTGEAMTGYVAPRTRSPFVLCHQVPSGYHHHRLTISTVKPDEYNQAVLSGFSVSASAPYRDGEGYRRQQGRVTNRNDFYVRHVSVFATLYDAWGRVVEADWALIEHPQPAPTPTPLVPPLQSPPRPVYENHDLAAGQTGSFETVTRRYEGAVRVEFRVTGLH